ncbi:MAG: cupin domain-containing protein [Psychrosphaera sp.]|nr:cupin domain-containing protein [Psychrosphaera sp.]
MTDSNNALNTPNTLNKTSNIETAELVLPCEELNETLEFYTDRLGFKVEAIFPADNPQVAVISGFGVRLRLAIGVNTAPGHLRLLCEHPASLNNGLLKFTAPNGTTIELVPAHPELVLPTLVPSFVHSRLNNDSQWGIGRAGMRYRDLIPDRLGGRFIASHIEITQGGEVPDYPHFHNVRFQLIFCYKGWAKLVYEDQGEAFLLEAGDCVLQPPRIRHQVLESSAGLEVIEVGCPAEHETFADHAMALPTDNLNPERLFNGQWFVRHIAKDAVWQDWRIAGFECRDTGITSATNGMVGVYVVRPTTPNDLMLKHHEEFLFIFVLTGHFSLTGIGDEPINVNTGDSIVIPAEQSHGIVDCTNDLTFLEIRLSDEFKTS